MIPDENAVMLYKFSESRWIQKILDGELSFSCAGAFICQAKRTGNCVQGDEREGVFARLKNDDPRIQEMSDKLGNDFEILPDGGYSFLRRRSAKLKPIFCVFAFTPEDILKSGQVLRAGTQKNQIRF